MRKDLGQKGRGDARDIDRSDAQGCARDPGLHAQPIWTTEAESACCTWCTRGCARRWSPRRAGRRRRRTRSNQPTGNQAFGGCPRSIVKVIAEQFVSNRGEDKRLKERHSTLPRNSGETHISQSDLAGRHLGLEPGPTPKEMPLEMRGQMTATPSNSDLHRALKPGPDS